ncbi:KxYKxGKxW signal peptide domain-containing protein [Furfurilactobacillus rossiae]|uniref:KxYKxGKxW signal peptide domain-containing protein n=1 Tax=Furfurilactobacillus rossiae TaxID=231049 RepID=UPI003B981525
MKQSKFLHMSEVSHHKMYKAGKVWLFAAIVGLSLGTATTVSQTSIVTAETTAATSSSGETSSTNQTSAALASSSTASNSNQSAASASSSTAPSKVTSTATSSTAQSDTSTAVKTVKNETADNSMTSANSASKSDTATAVDSTTDSISTSGETKSVTASSVQPVSQQPSAVKSDAMSLMSASSTVAKAAPKTSDVSSATPQSETVQSNVQASQTTVSTNSAQTKKTDSTSMSASQSVTQLSAVTPASVTTKATSIANQALTVVPAVKALQTLGQIDPTKFVKGTKVSISTDGTLIVDLPAGVSGDDIQQAKNSIKNLNISRAELTVNDDVISDLFNSVDYKIGENTALTGLKAVLFNASEGNYDIKEWMGDVDVSTLKFDTSSRNSDGTLDSVADKNAKSVISVWVDAQLQKVNFSTLSKSDPYTGVAELGIDGNPIPDSSSIAQQEGFTDTIKAYLRAQLTAEAYYLWLLEDTENTSNSEFYGAQGKFDGFSKLRTQMLTAENVQDLSSMQLSAYYAGFEGTINWISGDSTASSTLDSILALQGVGYSSSLLSGVGNTFGDLTMATFTWSPDAPTLLFYTFPVEANRLVDYEKSKVYFPFNQSDAGSGKTINNLNSLERALSEKGILDYYDDWKNVVTEGFKAATKDALRGDEHALVSAKVTDINSVSNYIGSITPEYYKTSNDSASRANLFKFAYIAAKTYLSGHFNGTSENKNIGKGNTSINTALDANGHLKENPEPSSFQNPSPLDLAIYSVLTGKSFIYSIEKGKNPIVSAAFQGNQTTETEADWIAPAAENDMYQIAWNTANQAKMDFLSDVQLVDCKFNPNFWTNWSA